MCAGSYSIIGFLFTVPWCFASLFYLLNDDRHLIDVLAFFSKVNYNGDSNIFQPKYSFNSLGDFSIFVNLTIKKRSSKRPRGIMGA